MARGITEQDVLEAADALLVRGERPTIERVRQELGRGSPNTVNRHLDAWWASLASRIQGSNGPGAALPAALLELCTRLYMGVRQQAQTEAEATLAAGRVGLQEREAQLETQKRAMVAEQAATAAAASQFAVELSALRDRNETLAAERAQLQAEVERLQSVARDALAAAQDARTAQEKAHAAHRAEVQKIRSQWEGNETRWLREIDHLREESKRQRSEHVAVVKCLRDQVKEYENRLATAAKDRQRWDAELGREREARIAAEAAGRATDALVKSLTPAPTMPRRRSKGEATGRRRSGPGDAQPGRADGGLTSRRRMPP